MLIILGGLPGVGKTTMAKGFDVYGLDISPQLIQFAKHVIPEKKLFLTDICEFTTDIHFDAIICWCTLFHIHVNQHLIVLKKIHSFLKPRGILLITFADTSCQPDGTNVKVVQLTTNKQRPKAKQFYERLGFQPTHEGMKYFLETSVEFA